MPSWDLQEYYCKNDSCNVRLSSNARASGSKICAKCIRLEREQKRSRKEIPIPTCKNTNRRTAKCRRMCCARADTRLREDDASGIQTRIDKLGSVQQQLNGWHQPRNKASSFNSSGSRKS